MTSKIIGLICLLVATTGFGFHALLNNKINDIDNLIRKHTTERDIYAHSYERFTESETKKLLHEIMLNIGLLFGKLDIKYSGSIRPQTESGIKTAEDNMLKIDKKRLLELAYTAASSKKDNIDPNDYKSQIEVRLGDMKNREEYSKIRNEVIQKLNKEIQRVQDEREVLEHKRESLIKTRDGLYIFYLFSQVIGIGFTFVGEAKNN